MTGAGEVVVVKTSEHRDVLGLNFRDIVSWG